MKNKQRNHDEDTEAILNRRRFLIKSTLAGAGLGAGLSAVLAGCKPCLSRASPETKPKPKSKPKPPESQPCLSVDIYRSTTQPKPLDPSSRPCLSPLRICLSPRE